MREMKLQSPGPYIFMLHSLSASDCTACMHANGMSIPIIMVGFTLIDDSTS